MPGKNTPIYPMRKKMIHEFVHPLPVKTDLGEGYALYVQTGGTFENDIWCVVLDDGKIRHFRTNQLRCVDNGTFGIKGG
jgi:hypothetical protein